MVSLFSRVVAILTLTLSCRQIALAMPTGSEKRQAVEVPPYVLSYGTLSSLSA